MSSRKPHPSHDTPAGPNGHGYCWEEHPRIGVHCTQPIGHERLGVEHLYPYTDPPIRWK